MPITPHISALMKKNHEGEVALSLDGEIIGIGKNAVIALENAKQKMPNIGEKEFLISRIQTKYVAA